MATPIETILAFGFVMKIHGLLTTGIVVGLLSVFLQGASLMTLLRASA